MLVWAPDLVGPPWRGPAPAPCPPAARAARWLRAGWRSSLLGSPPGPYSTCPSSALAGEPPLEAGPPPHATTLREKEAERVWVFRERRRGMSYLRGLDCKYKSEDREMSNGDIRTSIGRE